MEGQSELKQFYNEEFFVKYEGMPKFEDLDLFQRVELDRSHSFSWWKIDKAKEELQKTIIEEIKKFKNLFTNGNKT